MSTSNPRVVLVCEAAPHYHPTAMAHTTLEYIRFFRTESMSVHIVLPAGRVDFLVARLGVLPYDVHAPGLCRWGRYWIAAAPRLWPGVFFATLFPRLPLPVQRFLARSRDALRHARGVDHVIGRHLTPNESAFARDRIRTIGPDLVFYNTIFSIPSASLSDGDASSASRVRSSHGTRAVREYVITHDVKHERHRSFVQAGFRVIPPQFTRTMETAALRLVDNIIAIQWHEAETLRNMVPDANVLVVPTAMPLRHRNPDSPVTAGKCVFVGSGSLQNHEGVEWFLTAVWPTVRAHCPDARFHVYGSVCARIASSPAGVVLEGIVDSLDDAYKDAALCVVPLRIGSGLKMKLLEAFAYGVASVTTSIGAQGLPSFDETPYLLADDPDHFARAVASTLQSSERRMALEAAARNASRHFTAERAFAELRADIRSHLHRSTRP